MGVGLATSFQNDIDQIAYGLPGVRFLSPEDRHLTLKFIGEIETSQLPSIEESLGDSIREFQGKLEQESEQGPFIIKLRGIGRFARNNALWVGVDCEDGRLEYLTRRIDQNLSRLGFAKEKRNFQPHVTIGRIQRVSDDRLHEFFQLHSSFETGWDRCDHLHIYCSELRPEGAKYTIESSFPLSLDT